MMQVYLNRKVHRGPYGGGNMFVKAFHELAPSYPNIEDLLNTDGRINPDVILLAGLENEHPDISAEQAIVYKMYVKPECQLVLRVNENDARKGTDHMDRILLALSEHVDATVFVSKWIKDYFVGKGWACKNNTVIVNGVDHDVFKPQPKLNNGKLNIVAHHWSDNRMKGADIYEAIDEFVGKHPERFAFTYIGRHRCSFNHTNVVRPLYGKALGEELGRHDFYVSASLHDPGPNHILEALACGLPTAVHYNGGGAVDFVGTDHVFYDWDDLRRILTTGACNVPNSVFTPPTWQTCIQEYITVLENTYLKRHETQKST